MILSTLDWALIGVFFLVTFIIGLLSYRQSSKNFAAFFLSSRDMPWWLLGVSMVATTFSADTPNLVTDIVRKNGVSGNWAWWAFLLTGMLTVFVYARLWRRSGIQTDLEFYELRYSGKMAAFLRGFRAIYLGLFFNVFIMATVCLAAIKIGSVLLGLSPVQTLLIALLVTVAYSALGGLRGVIIADFFQFAIAMVGTIWAAIVIVNLPEVGGLNKLITAEPLQGKLHFLPDFSNSELLIPLFVVPLAVQWWSVWYPGAEPGGGGYIAQRMFAAKDEKNAVLATLLFNVAHYALRPWPWILIALSSIIVFPTLNDIQAAFPSVAPEVINDDLAFPAMLTFLPHGLLGLVVASLIAAFTSTISTHLNWGASYIVNDWYLRFIKPDATDQELVRLGRIATFVLMVLATVFALLLQNALQAFNILLQIGAGTGLIFILRWFWWRINAYSEISAMIVSFVVALYFEFVHPALGFEVLADYQKLIIGIAITTASWITVTLMTPPTDEKTLVQFYKLIRPAAAGWKPVLDKAIANNELQADEVSEGQLPLEILGMLIGCILVYSALFATGFWIYGNTFSALVTTVSTVVAAFLLSQIWRRLQVSKQ